MQKQNILKQYGAQDLAVPQEFMPWMRSNHAGETGAVWIYKGAACAFWSKTIREMAKQHGKVEQQHLIVMASLVPKNQRSRLLLLWRIMGFGLGFVPSLFGYSAFCITIKAVETFVEQHYKQQIYALASNRTHSQLHLQLRKVLQQCCDEEIHHRHDAYERINKPKLSLIAQCWSAVVGAGSSLAVKAAVRF